MQARIKSAALVLVLSCIVWVFAEREVTQEAVTPLFVELFSMKPDFLVELLDHSDQPASSNTQQIRLAVEGPAGRLDILDQGIDNPPRFDLAEAFYEGVAEGESEIKEVQIAEDLFKKEILYKETYLKVKESDPPVLKVRLTRMRLEEVPVKLYGESGELSGATVVPETVKAYVIPGQVGVARVRLKPAQQIQATEEEITVNCLVDHEDPEANYQVKVKFPEQASPLQEFEISPARLGYLFGESMKGKYDVVIEDKNVLKDMKIIGRGTVLAIEAYRKSEFHLALEIYESDSFDEPIPRKLVYYLPLAYTDKIFIEQNPILLRFRVALLPEPDTTPKPIPVLSESP